MKKKRIVKPKSGWIILALISVAILAYFIGAIFDVPYLQSEVSDKGFANETLHINPILGIGPEGEIIGGSKTTEIGMP